MVGMSKKRNKSKSGLRIQAMADEAIIWVYGDIGANGITAMYFKEQLESLGDIKQLTIRINSNGGEVSEVVAIHSILAKHPASIRVEIDGFALSSASLLAMAGQPVVMSENAVMMIHEPWSSLGGNAENLRKGADALEMVADQMVNIYRTKTGLSKNRIKQMMADETWLNSDEALRLGFCDEISEAEKIAACFDLSKFEVPKKFTEKNKMGKKIKAGAKPLNAGAIAAAALKAEGKRREDVRAIFGAHSKGNEGLMMACLDDMNCTAESASTQLLNALGAASGDPFGTTIIVGDGGSTGKTAFMEAATDALLIRQGVPVAEPSPAAQDLKHTSIVAMAESCLSLAGRPSAGMNPNKILAAAHSTSDFPFLLSGVASKALMHGFENEPASHKAWVKTVEVKDFKEIQRIQRSDAPGLLEVPEGAEYTEGSFGEKKEVYAVKTYGRLFSITRQAMINDDLGAFTTLPQAFGASARRLEADHVYNILTANAAMADGTALFHADHNNLADTAAALSFATLSEGRAAMRKQLGTNGALLNILPAYLIVPASLEGDAESLLASLARPDQANPGVANSEFIRSLQLVVDPRLDLDSETIWYLAGSNTQVDTIEMAYLEGQHGLDYEEKEGWEVDGLSVKARLDFGTKAIDWRGFYMNPGA